MKFLECRTGWKIEDCVWKEAGATVYVRADAILSIEPVEPTTDGESLGVTVLVRDPYGRRYYASGSPRNVVARLGMEVA